MEIFLQHKSSWLDTASRNLHQKNNRVNLLSKDGHVTSVPVQFLIASSPLLQSTLISSCFCESSTASSISLPSATISTLKLLVQILCKGETEESGGLDTTMTNLRELQDVIALLGLNVKICPTLSCDKRRNDNESFYSGSVIVKDEVLASEDTFEEVDGSDQQTVKKATGAKKTSVKFNQSGLLKNFKVNLVKCLVRKDNPEEEDQNLEKSGNERNMCNICGAEFAKFPSLRRHYRENHGIQDEKSLSENIKPSENNCPKCTMKFRFRGSLLRHFRRQHKKHEDTRNHKNSEYEVKLAHRRGMEVHMKNSASDYEEGLRYKCQNCEKKYSNSWNLLRHRQDKHSDFINEIKSQQDISVNCKECGLVLTNQKNLNQHLQEVHKKSKEESAGVKKKSKSGISPRRFKCSDCDETFKHSSNMTRHKDRIHEGKTYGCGVCGHVCGYRSGVLGHCIAKGHDKSLIYTIVDFP